MDSERARRAETESARDEVDRGKERAQAKEKQTLARPQRERDHAGPRVEGISRECHGLSCDVGRSAKTRTKIIITIDISESRTIIQSGDLQIL